MENIEGVITSKGQLVIPSKLRQALNIGHGTRVRFERITGGIAIYPMTAALGIAGSRGILAGLGLPPDIEREPERDIS
jgi:AbrB family looped-hinge helix DNA binding protein